MKPTPVERALLSVSDKTGIVGFARKLADKGIEILSTGGTSKILHDSNIPVVSVDTFTGHPEIMDGRVKTLHPKVHGGILAMRENPLHREHMRQNNIKPIDLVVVNLYPFKQTIARSDVTIEEAIENIDIGGPTMVRSSAKNHAWVTIVVDPADYEAIIAELYENSAISFETRKKCAVKAFRHTADYDSAIDGYLSKIYLNEQILRLSYNNGTGMRYGENPHQKAVFYKNDTCSEPCMANALILHGKELSYNNIADGDAALEMIKELTQVPAAVVVKHSNPCGCATGTDGAAAIEAAWSGDPISAFGSIIAVSRIVDAAAAKALENRFVELLIAPDFTPDALEYLKAKSSALRLIAVGDLTGCPREPFTVKHVTGGLLRQDRDLSDIGKWECVTRAPFPDARRELALFGWKVCKQVKSNAIVLVHEYAHGLFRLLGMGAGQPNRIDALRKLALTKARENLGSEYTAAGKSLPAADFPELGNTILASDAFFPFPDAVEEAHKAGIRYIVQPGGSKRDDEVIAAADAFRIAMVFTGMRHFKH